MNIELRQTRQVNEKELGMTLVFSKEKQTLLFYLNLRRFSMDHLPTIYFILENPLYKDFYIS